MGLAIFLLFLSTSSLVYSASVASDAKNLDTNERVSPVDDDELEKDDYMNNYLVDDPSDDAAFYDRQLDKRAPMDRSSMIRFGRAPMDRTSMVRLGKRTPMDRTSMVRFGKREPMDRSSMVRFGKRGDGAVWPETWNNPVSM